MAPDAALVSRLRALCYEVLPVRHGVPFEEAAIEAAIEFAPRFVPQQGSPFTRGMQLSEAAARLLDLAGALRAQVAGRDPDLGADVHPAARERIMRERAAHAGELRGTVNREAVAEAAARLERALQEVQEQNGYRRSDSESLFGPPG